MHFPEQCFHIQMSLIVLSLLQRSSKLKGGEEKISGVRISSIIVCMHDSRMALPHSNFEWTLAPALC